MNLKHVLQSMPLPERQPFFNRLQAELFKQPIKQHHPWRWFGFSLTGVATATAIIAGFYLIPNHFMHGTLGAAIANTTQFTTSDQLVRQRITVDRYLGLPDPDSQPNSFDGQGNKLPPFQYDQHNQIADTFYLWQDNARGDWKHVEDDKETRGSYLASALDGSRCEWDNTISEQPTCNRPTPIPPELALHNGNSLSVIGLKLEQTNDATNSIQLSWQSDRPLVNPEIKLSAGPSGYGVGGTEAHASTDDQGQQWYSASLDSFSMHTNAVNQLYQDRSGLADLQISDATGVSQVYLIDIDQLTARALSNDELAAAQTEFVNLFDSYNLSTESMEQAYESTFNSIIILQKNLSKLELLHQETNGELTTYAYKISNQLSIGAGTNNAQATQATFTIDTVNNRVLSYSFSDANGTVVETAQIERSVLTDDPKTIFTKDAWLSSLKNE